MKILLSAFACMPNTGSETGAGWKWAVELARAGHEVVVLTDSSRRQGIETELNRRPRENLSVVCYRPLWLRGLPLNSLTANALFSAWQYSLLPIAQKLHKKNGFDLAVHLTYGVFRHPSFLGFLDVPFVFGPVGGGEDAPWELKSKLPLGVRAKELVRSIANVSASWNPMLRIALSRASLILVRTDETRLALPRFCEPKIRLFQEIGIDLAQHAKAQTGAVRDVGSPLRVMFAGRLLGWKGVHLAIRAVEQAHAAGCDIHFTIVGSGPLGPWLKQLVENLGIKELVKWVSHVPQEELFELYQQSHVFLFPSLHDSGGNVVLEAQAFGCPVICLDLGGPATLIDAHSAVVISTRGCVETEVVDRLALALVDMASNEGERLIRAQAAIHNVARFSWERRVADFVSLVQREGLVHCEPPAFGR